MQELPPDIWALVTQTISLRELMKMMSVNRAFFDLALDARYRTAEWTMLDQKMIRQLDCLQSPSIAIRVRRLYIRPWFIPYLFERESLFRKSSKLKKKERKNSWAETFTQISNYFYPPQAQSISEDLETTHPVSKVLPSPHELVLSMIGAVKGMINVTEYEFRWRDMPVLPETLSFLYATRSAFHSNLSKLAIHCRISMFGQILSFTDFCGLSELELYFEYDPSTESGIDTKNARILLDVVAPFVNHLRPTLRSLTIGSVGKGDHSPFLRALGPFTGLRLLTLRMSVGPEYLSDHSAIGDFLLRHKSFISSVSVRPDGENGPIKVLMTRSWQSVSNACMANESWLNNLEFLSFPTPHLPIMLNLIPRLSGHLTGLHLFGRYLNGTEVETVIGLLGGLTNLKSLSLDIRELSSDMFTLLGNTLPGLYSLSFVLLASPQQKSVYSQVYFQNQHYLCQTEWKLYDLAIYHEYKDTSYGPAREAEHRLMTLALLLRCAPCAKLQRTRK
ncbi:hypothetical protein H0H87_008504 [Tephrocybe sp. NHM501043]|nr:hypothetical protein H0H87_008504 [Tephrocybe sp. NHM501043]